MKIDSNYSIEPDKYCWILKYEKIGDVNKDTGKVAIHRDSTYHPTISSALRRYMDSSLKKCGSIDEVIERIKELELKINKLNK